MSYYDLTKEQRSALSARIHSDLQADLEKKLTGFFMQYFSDGDTYIRKAAYLAIGRIWKKEKGLEERILKTLEKLFQADDFSVRQTVINAAGEIGIITFEPVEHFFDAGLTDRHHAVRNAVIGSVKKMGEKNPGPVLHWAKKYLHHPDKEIRREICHGIELRGRTHPQDILPLLRVLEHDKTARVKNTLVHVIGQISYKKNCLAAVIGDLNSWTNKELTDQAVEEIIDVHDRYKDFAILTQQEAEDYIRKNYRKS